MVKRIKQTRVRPGIVGWVETLFRGGVCMYLTNEGEGTVEIGVPRDGANGEEGCGRKGRTGVGERLSPAKLNSRVSYHE